MAGYFEKGRNCDTLKDAFTTFLPKDFRCRIRYAHTPPRPCDPLFSPCPGMDAEKTRLARHFLTVSVPTLATITPNNAPRDDHIFVFAMEVLIYSTAGLTTMFVSKADSTGYLPYRRPSPLKSIASTFLWWLSKQQRNRTPQDPTRAKRLVISLFARSQPAYLFPGSADNTGKHILDDRQLIKWWARVLDPLFPAPPTPQTQEPEYQGYMTVPGYPGNEIKRFLPPSVPSSTPHWTPRNPLPELAQARGLPPQAPPRCLLPRFPDDPKARFMTDLDAEVGLAEDSATLASQPSADASAGAAKGQGVWNSITSLDRFWEAMEFRQECSSGRVVGFLWLVIRPSADEQNAPHAPATDHENLDIPASQGSLQVTSQPSSQQSRKRSPSRDSARSRSSARRSPLTGPIHPRAPRPKGSSSNPSQPSLSATADPSDPSNPNTRDGAFLTSAGYDRALTSLTNLDYSTPSTAAHSTKKWVAEVSSMSGLPEVGWGIDVVGTAEVEAIGGGRSDGGAPVTNDLGGLVRKRKKATT